MDWNNDGKHDWQDHAFYNNVIDSNDKQVEHSVGRNTGKQNSNGYTSQSSGKGVFIVVLICVGYLLIKLISS